MADKYGVNYTKANISNPRIIVPKATYDCKVKASYDKYVLSAALATGDVLFLGKIPSGARVVEVMLRSTDLGGTDSVLKVGVVGSDALFISNTDVSGQAIKVLSDTASAGILADGATAERDVIVTHTGTCVATTGTIEVLVKYMLD